MTSKKIFAAVVSLAAAASMLSAVPFSAGAASSYSSTISGEKTTSFDKYLVMKNDATVPDAAFEFEIAPGASIGSADGKMEILAGIGEPKFTTSGTGTNNAGTDTKAKAAFTSTDSTAAESTKGDKTITFMTTDDTSDEKFATKTIQIDFSGVAFTEPGIYRYIITESGSTVAGITNDSQLTRTLDVYVVDDAESETPKLKIDSYVLHTGTDAPSRNKAKTGEGETGYEESAGKLDDKSTGFTNSYSTQNLSFSKEVTGNQGSKDKYFKFTLKIENAGGATLQVGGQFDTALTGTAAPNTATVYTAESINAANGTDENTTLTDQQLYIDSNDAKTYTFYLQHGQHVDLSGLPKNATYTLTEDAEDYASSNGNSLIAVPASGTEGETGYQAAITYNDATSGTIDEDDIYTGFTNNRSGAIPTGILLSVAAPALIGILVLCGIIFLVLKGKKRRAEEE